MTAVKQILYNRQPDKAGGSGHNYPHNPSLLLFILRTGIRYSG
jgi:hypothetical protein